MKNQQKVHFSRNEFTWTENELVWAFVWRYVTNNWKLRNFWYESNFYKIFVVIDLLNYQNLCNLTFTASLAHDSYSKINENNSTSKFAMVMLSNTKFYNHFWIT